MTHEGLYMENLAIDRIRAVPFDFFKKIFKTNSHLRNFINETLSYTKTNRKKAYNDRKTTEYV